MKTILLAPILVCALPLTLREEPYFPIKTKAGDEGISAFEARWYGKALERMKEPRLSDFTKDANADVYRILILPTWGNPIVVRVQKHEETYCLSAHRLDGAGGYDPGKLVETKKVELTYYDSKALQDLLQNLDFFHLPTDDEVLGFDGEEWILEGVSQGKYHVVQRWCPTSYDPDKRGLRPFLNLCSFLLNKCQLSKDRVPKAT